MMRGRVCHWYVARIVLNLMKANFVHADVPSEILLW